LSRKIVMESGRTARKKIAGQLGAFLYRLHTTPLTDAAWEIPSTRAPVRREDWLRIQARVKERIYPLLQRYQVQWAEDLFGSVLDHPEDSSFQPALIHGDLASYHILFDDRQGRITGVIDFGMAGLGDPASDLGLLISVYGESFVSQMGRSYPGLEKYLPRARFYSQLVELEWTLLGLETGETFWFTAHLGGARDLLA
jgi:aminoglycoside 2''-phosphotransferase